MVDHEKRVASAFALFLGCLLMLIPLIWGMLPQLEEPDYGGCGTINPPSISEVMELSPSYFEGEQLFQVCMACHSLIRDELGPRLYALDKVGDEIWFHNWVVGADRGEPRLSQDSLEYTCQFFPTLTREETDAIWIYLEAFGAYQSFY